MGEKRNPHEDHFATMAHASTPFYRAAAAGEATGAAAAALGRKIGRKASAQLGVATRAGRRKAAGEEMARAMGKMPEAVARYARKGAQAVEIGAVAMERAATLQRLSNAAKWAAHGARFAGRAAGVTGVAIDVLSPDELGDSTLKGKKFSGMWAGRRGKVKQWVPATPTVTVTANRKRNNYE